MKKHDEQRTSNLVSILKYLPNIDIVKSVIPILDYVHFMPVPLYHKENNTFIVLWINNGVWTKLFSIRKSYEIF